MEIPKALIDRLEENEAIAKKFNEIEISILSILNFNDFFERLLREISDKFSIAHIWIAIIRESCIASQLETGNTPEWLSHSSAFVSRDSFLEIIQNSRHPLLDNKNLTRFDPLIPKPAAFNIGSIAVAPITLDGKIVGSINQADTRVDRFEPGLDTTLLEQLALKVSLCLSNVTAHEQLKFLAFHDPLTGLLNRGVMERVINREFLRAQRYNGELSIIFLDLDDFKTINDSAGHDVGDKALCRTADTLTRLKRDSDIVARFAGDEFVAILPSTGKSQAKNYIKRVAACLDDTPLKFGNDFLPVKLSYGIANMADPGVIDSRSLLKIAHPALYREKNRKKALG